jgi:hypothetical protein
MVMTLKQMLKAIEANELLAVKKELCRYGSILDLTDWQDADGYRRRYIIKHLHTLFVIAMLNGETIGIKPQL